MSLQRRLAAAGLSLVLAGSTTSSAVASTGTPGAEGIGDPDFPKDGNGGYDVEHYGLELSYDPATKRLAGDAEITAKAVQDLSRFSLDLTGLTVSRVTVDGAKATFRRKGQELIVSPGRALPDGARFVVRVSYAGEPKPVRNSPNLGTYGFIPTKDGAFVACQPNGARTWFPGNDHPADKATFDFKITVPEGLTVLANGEQAAKPRTEAGRTTFTWRERHPMATYLATMTLGKFSVRTGTSKGGIPVIAAVDPKFRGSLDRLYSTTAEITDYWSKVFGPYPFSSTGGVVDDFDAGYALEDQTKVLYGGFDPDESIIAHELAHQWYGDSVAVDQWRDLWLNEGFATYAEWLWSEHQGKGTVSALFQQAYKTSPQEIWAYPPGRAKPKDLFNQSVYIRGGMTLHALRQRIGDRTFFNLLRTWYREHRDGNVTTPQFIALAEKMSGKDLGSSSTCGCSSRSSPRAGDQRAPPGF